MGVSLPLLIYASFGIFYSFWPGYLVAGLTFDLVGYLYPSWELTFQWLAWPLVHWGKESLSFWLLWSAHVLLIEHGFYLSHRSSVLRLVWSALKQWDSAAVCGKVQQRSCWWTGRGLLMDPGEKILGSGTVWLASRSLTYSSDCYGLFLSWWSLSVLGESTDQREDKSERMWVAEGVFREQVPGVGQSSWQMGHSLAASCSSDECGPHASNGILLVQGGTGDEVEGRTYHIFISLESNAILAASVSSNERLRSMFSH